MLARRKRTLPVIPIIPMLVLLTSVLLQPVNGTAADRRPSDCRRCHGVLPEHHPPVESARRDCMACHSGHDRQHMGEKIPRRNSDSYRSDWWHVATVDHLATAILLGGILGPLIHGLLFLVTCPLRNPPPDRQKPRRPSVRPVVLRCWHATNAMTVVLLGASGISLRGLLGDISMPFSVVALRWHSWLGVFHLFVWGGWLGLKLTGAWRNHGCRPPFGERVKDTGRQLAYYAWGMFFGHPQPRCQQIFNPLQWLVYCLIMSFLLPLVLLSGCGLFLLHMGLVPGLWSWRSFLVETHFLGGCLLLGFLSVHLYLAAWGPGGRLWKRA